MKSTIGLLGLWLTRAGLLFMRLAAHLPLPVIRAMGVVLGWLLYMLVGSRRRVVHTNLALCFPDQSLAERRKLARQSFVYFAQAWLDRSWLWHAPVAVVQRRVQITGALDQLAGNDPVVVFVPHFVGLDAAWGGVARRIPRPSCSIYTDQSNKLIDDWILQGRRRYGGLKLFSRAEGVKPVVSAVRKGMPLYLLADMDFGPEESVFVPFFGVQAATVPSLPRFARLGKAKVFAVLCRMTAQGYDIEALPFWQNYPSDDVMADTALMNARLQDYIATMPAQYYWVHKRFKTRASGEPSLYP